MLKIDSNLCLLIRYEHGCISHMLSLVITLKLKDLDDEDEMMVMDDGYSIWFYWSDNIDNV